MIVSVPLLTVTSLADVVPDTVTVSSLSSTASSTGVKVKVPIACVASAGMTMVKSDTAVKSSPSVAVLPATLTFTAVSPGRLPESKRAVTVMLLAPPPSLTLAGCTSSVRSVAGGS